MNKEQIKKDSKQLNKDLKEYFKKVKEETKDFKKRFEKIDKELHKMWNIESLSYEEKSKINKDFDKVLDSLYKIEEYFNYF